MTGSVQPDRFPTFKEYAKGSLESARRRWGERQLIYATAAEVADEKGDQEMAFAFRLAASLHLEVKP